MARFKGPDEGVSITEALRGAKRVSGPVIDIPESYLAPVVMSKEFAERLRASAESVEMRDREFGFMVMRGPYTGPGTIQTAFSKVASGEDRDSTDIGAIANDTLRRLRGRDVRHALFPFITVHFHVDPGIIVPSDPDLKVAAQMVAAFSVPVINVIAMPREPGKGGRIDMLAFQEPASGSPILASDPGVKDIEGMLKEENLRVPAELKMLLYLAEEQLKSQAHVVQALDFFGYKAKLISADGSGRISEGDANSFGKLFAYEPYERLPGQAE